MIRSAIISTPADTSIITFRIAPSMPTLELNLWYFIARPTPRIVSSTTANSSSLISEFPPSNAMKSFMIMFLNPFSVFSPKVPALQ